VTAATARTAPPARPGLVPVLLYLGALVAVISSLGAPLVPAIAAADHVSLTSAQWSLTVTLVVGAVATPVIGRLGDGPRRRAVVLTVLAVVLVGSVLAALPLGLGWLVLGRGLQGLGLGLSPLGIATARTVLQGERARSTASALSVTVAAGVGLGYPLTGLIAELGGVHAAFWFGAAATAVALVAAAAVYPAGAAAARPLDLPGALLLGAGLATGLLALGQGETWGWTSGRVVGLFAVAVVALAAWVVWQLRTPAPLVDLRLARGRAAVTAHVGALLVGLANYLMLSSVPQLVQTPESTGYGFGSSIVVAGLVLLPFSLASFLASRLARPLDRVGGPRAVLLAGALVLALGDALLGLWRGELWELFVDTAVAGLGVGATFSALPGLITGAVPASETGSAMSLNQVFRYVGFALGSALTGTLLEAATPAGRSFATSGGYSAVAAVACGAALVFAVVALVVPPRVRRPQAVPAAAR
jgi:MFS family permease